jgi:hypothetical protein
LCKKLLPKIEQEMKPVLAKPEVPKVTIEQASVNVVSLFENAAARLQKLPAISQRDFAVTALHENRLHLLALISELAPLPFNAKEPTGARERFIRDTGGCVNPYSASPQA